eukprot:g54876.t1
MCKYSRGYSSSVFLKGCLFISVLTFAEPALAPATSTLRKWTLPKLIGELMWPATMTQPQICYAVNRISVLGHQAPDVACSMIATNNALTALQLSSFSDSDFGPVYWNSRRQSTVALSTIDAEVISLSQTARAHCDQCRQPGGLSPLQQMGLVVREKKVSFMVSLSDYLDKGEESFSVASSDVDLSIG